MTSNLRERRSEGMRRQKAIATNGSWRGKCGLTEDDKSEECAVRRRLRLFFGDFERSLHRDRGRKECAVRR